MLYIKFRDHNRKLVLRESVVTNYNVGLQLYIQNSTEAKTNMFSSLVKEEYKIRVNGYELFSLTHA